jgi:uncharacterized flavoprotein (TIGR03862 family)
MIKKKVGIVGTGPAALMAGTILVQNNFEVLFFDQKKAAGRKFLVAGDGGFNLSNLEPLSYFIKKFNSEIIVKAVEQFTAIEFRTFLKSIGIETYEGSSGKLFPIVGTKPIDVLQNWINYLKSNGAKFHFSYRLIDFDERFLKFITTEEKKEIKVDFCLFALGGASWKITGSDGSWIKLFREKGINCINFESSNSGLVLDEAQIAVSLEGEFIKNCCLFSDNIERMGDLVVTKYGLEGAPAYAMNMSFRKAIPIYCDFKPANTIEELSIKLKTARNCTEGLKNLKLAKTVINWLKFNLSKEEYTNPILLAQKIKKFQLNTISLRPIDEVISTVGGVDMNEINEEFKLKKFETLYVAGEMLDWDAPTGGYLIQGAVATGYCAARAICKR